MARFLETHLKFLKFVQIYGPQIFFQLILSLIFLKYKSLTVQHLSTLSLKSNRFQIIAKFYNFLGCFLHYPGRGGDAVRPQLQLCHLLQDDLHCGGPGGHTQPHPRPPPPPATPRYQVIPQAGGGNPYNSQAVEIIVWETVKFTINVLKRENHINNIQYT